MGLLLVFLLYAAALSAALAARGFAHGTVPPIPGGGPRPQRVLVIGATGGTGRQLVLQALERGLTVTALVRNPARLDLRHDRLKILKGDVLDEASVAAAMAGQEAVLCALGHKRFLGPSRILSEGTRNLLRAMEVHGARRFVGETSLGIGDSAWRMGLSYSLFTIPVVLPFYFWDKTRQERIIAGSSLEWVIVRPGALTNASARGRVRHGRQVGHVVETRRIARADVAAFMLDQLVSDTYLGAAPGVTW